MLQSICDSAHEQCGRLLSSRTKDGALLERVSSQEFVALAQLIEKFVDDCQQISGHRALGLRLAFQVHLFRIGMSRKGSNNYITYRVKPHGSFKSSMKSDAPSWAPSWTVNDGGKLMLRRMSKSLLMHSLHLQHILPSWVLQELWCRKKSEKRRQ